MNLAVVCCEVEVGGGKKGKSFNLGRKKKNFFHTGGREKKSVGGYGGRRFWSFKNLWRTAGKKGEEKKKICAERSRVNKNKRSSLHGKLSSKGKRGSHFVLTRSQKKRT